MSCNWEDPVERRKLLAVEARGRRQQLMEQVDDDTVFIIPAAREKMRNRDSGYPFRQNSDFLYLSAFPEPDAMLVLVPGNDVEQILFCRPRAPEIELWSGPRAGPEAASEEYYFDAAYSVDELDKKIPQLLTGRRTIYYALGQDEGFERKLHQWCAGLRAAQRRGITAPEKIFTPESLIGRQRLIKSPLEQKLMNRAAAISERAHMRAMQRCRPGIYEYSLEAELWHEFVDSGARFPAYNHIVGAGSNACTLHYTDNSCLIRDGDLVLIDAGCEIDGYAADITRTFPANGRFDGPQRALYEIVYRAQQRAIEAVAPGADWDLIHNTAVKVLCEGLCELNILREDASSALASGSWKQFYPHGSGHWLGLDVHDSGDYRNPSGWVKFAPGMTLTIEPGLYIPTEAEGVDARWLGLGIRIEDDVLVTAEGREIMTAGLPKAADDIEALMKTGG